MRHRLTHLHGRCSPGLLDLLEYRRADLSHDLTAGLAVAAVALPVGVVYAQLTGFTPAVGLYSSMHPLLANFFFGSSHQLIIGPDAATCALIAATVTPLAAGDAQACIAASFLKLDVLADLLLRPILVGFLNGVAISIALGQSGQLFGFAAEQQGVIAVTQEIIDKFSLVHWPTLLVVMLAFTVLLLSARLFRRLPTALLAMLVAGLALTLLDLGSLRRFWKLDWREFVLSLIAMIGVIWIGALQAILFVVLLAGAAVLRQADCPAHGRGVWHYRGCFRLPCPGSPR